jgi:hypothetical protein
MSGSTPSPLPLPIYSAPAACRHRARPPHRLVGPAAGCCAGARTGTFSGRAAGRLYAAAVLIAINWLVTCGGNAGLSWRRARLLHHPAVVTCSGVLVFRERWPLRQWLGRRSPRRRNLTLAYGSPWMPSGWRSGSYAWQRRGAARAARRAHAGNRDPVHPALVSADPAGKRRGCVEDRRAH